MHSGTEGSGVAAGREPAELVYAFLRSPESSPSLERILGNSDRQDLIQLARCESGTICGLPTCLLPLPLFPWPGVLPSSLQTGLLSPQCSLVPLPMLSWVPGRPLLLGLSWLPPYS